MENFESWMARRRQEIQVELMQLEVKAWTDVDKEQQAAINTQQRKLDLITAELHRARVLKREKAAAFVERVQSHAAGPAAEVRPRRSGRQDGQTQTEALATDRSAGLQEVEIARGEVDALMKKAEVYAEQIRLSKEPLEGASFIRIRNSQRIEEDALKELGKRIAELERDVREAEIAANLAGFTARDTSEWIPKDVPSEAPWDELVPVHARPVFSEPIEVQARAFQGVLRLPGLQQGVLRFTRVPVGASQGVPRPTAVRAGASQGVPRFTGAQVGASQGAPRPTGVETKPFSGMFRPHGVQAGASQHGGLRPTGVQAAHGAYRAPGLAPGLAPAPRAAGGSSCTVGTASQPAVQAETLAREFQTDMGLSWPVSQGAAGPAPSTSRGHFVPKKPLLPKD